MGTNFFVSPRTVTDFMDSDPSHIGKRSAAGMWCWDCGITLCETGEPGIHQSGSRWLKACPRCGKKPEREPVSISSAGRELGFNNSSPERKTGVASCASFTWAMDPGALEGVETVENEYGRSYTREEFLRVLEGYPVQFLDMIGREFS